MRELVFEFMTLGDWLQQLLFLEVHPEILQQEFLDELRTVVRAVADRDAWPLWEQGYKIVAYSVEYGREKAYEGAYYLRMAKTNDHDAWLHDYFMWEDDMRLLERAAKQIAGIHRHVMCAYRLAFELELVPEEHVSVRANALARWSLARLYTPETPTAAEFRVARERLEEAQMLAREAQDDDISVTVLYVSALADYRGSCWGYVAALDQAIGELEEALRLGPSGSLRAAVLIQLAEVLRHPSVRHDAQYLERAIICLTEAIEIAQSERDASLELACLWGLGQTYSHRHVGPRIANWQTSTKYYRRACDLAKDMGDTHQEGQIALELAGVYAIQADTDRDAWTQAKSLYDRWSGEFDPDTYPFEAAQINDGLAMLHASLSAVGSAEDTYQSLAHYESALHLYERAERPDRQAGILGSMGTVYAQSPVGDRSENLERAIWYFQRAAKGLQGRDMEAYGTALYNLGIAFTDLPGRDRFTNLEKARDYLTMALHIRTPNRFPLAYADALEALAGVHAKLTPGGAAPRMQRVIEEFQEALRWREKLDTPLNCARTKEKLATALSDIDAPEKADTLRRSIALFEQVSVVFRDHRETAAYAHLQRNMGLARLQLHGLERTGSKEAVKAFHEALRIYRSDTYPVDRRKTLHDLGHLYLRDHEWSRGHAACEEAIAITEVLYSRAVTDAARVGEMAEATDLYSCDAYCLARMGRYAEAVERLENARTRTLVETMRLRHARVETLRLTDKDRFRGAVRRAAALEAEMAMSSVSAGQTPRPFHALSHELAECRATVRSFESILPGAFCTFSEIASLSDTAAPYVYLTITDVGSLAVIVPHGAKAFTSSHVVWLDRFDNDAMKREFLGWYGGPSILLNLWHLETGDLGEPLDRFLGILGSDLMGPLCTRLKALGFGRMRLIACQELSSMPLHAARIGENGWADEVVEIAYQPCAQMSRWKRATAPAARSLLAVVVSDYQSSADGQSDDRPLPFAIPEVASVSREFAQCRVLSGSDATRERVLPSLSRGVTHLHMACHGRFVPQAVLTSRLALHGRSGLTLADLQGVDLGSELVVLSACQTALPDARNAPDELIGFPTAFLRSGAQGVIAAQWPVADEAAAILLAAFYRYHMRDGLAPQAALRRAQQWLRGASASEMLLTDWYKAAYKGRAMPETVAKRISYYEKYPSAQPFAKPYFWAGFIYIGI